MANVGFLSLEGQLVFLEVLHGVHGKPLERNEGLGNEAAARSASKGALLGRKIGLYALD